MYSYICCCCCCIFLTTFFCKKEMKMEPFSLFTLVPTIYFPEFWHLLAVIVCKITKGFSNSTLSGFSETMIFRTFQSALAIRTVIDQRRRILNFISYLYSCPKNEDSTKSLLLWSHIYTKDIHPRRHLLTGCPKMPSHADMGRGQRICDDRV